MSKSKDEAPSWGFDPSRDIAAVEQFGYVDLVAANRTSSVPASITSDDTKFNGIEEPGAVAGRPRDIFEQGQAAKVVAGYQAPSSEEKHDE